MNNFVAIFSFDIFIDDIKQAYKDKRIIERQFNTKEKALNFIQEMSNIHTIFWPQIYNKTTKKTDWIGDKLS